MWMWIGLGIERALVAVRILRAQTQGGERGRRAAVGLRRSESVWLRVLASAPQEPSKSSLLNRITTLRKA